jgi:hypothetical protein
MSLTTDFISELVRAANESDRLTHYEISRLFDRAIDTIHDMREQAGAVEAHRARDVLIDLQISSDRARDLSTEEVRDALADAADVIRTLKSSWNGAGDLTLSRSALRNRKSDQRDRCLQAIAAVQAGGA